MIDIEFAVQFLVLAHAHRHAELTQQPGQYRAAGDGRGRCGLIDRDLAEQGRDAYRNFRRLQHALRLNGAPYARVPAGQVAAQAQAVRDLWRTVFERYT